MISLVTCMDESEVGEPKIHCMLLYVILTFIAVLYLANKFPLFFESKNTFPSISYASPAHSCKCEDIHVRKVHVFQTKFTAIGILPFTGIYM